MDCVLLQEPWISKGKVAGLSSQDGNLLHCREEASPRAAVLIKNNLTYVPIASCTTKDLVAVDIVAQPKGVQ